MITLARLRQIRIICRKDLNGAYFCNIGPRKLALYRDSTFYEASELPWRYLKAANFLVAFYLVGKNKLEKELT